MKFYTQQQMEDKHIGAIGTTSRDTYEQEKELFLIGEAIRQARKAQNLSQEQLGEMIGVQKAQISRVENGSNLTLSTIAKVFKALGQKISLEIPSVGKVALW